MRLTSKIIQAIRCKYSLVNYLLLLTVLTGCTAKSPNTHTTSHPPTTGMEQQETIDTNHDITGQWVNQRGSILTITEATETTIKGYFITAVANTKSCIGYPAPFTGHRNGNALSLSLTLTGCNSPVVIAMTGATHTNARGQEEINMLATIQYRGKELWNSRIVSTDFYTRKPIGAVEENK